jgi:hypothetical protein
LGNLTPEEFAAQAAAGEGSSALARTAQPAQEPLALAAQSATASNSKPYVSNHLNLPVIII